jgi:hypothetical protein
MNTETRHQSPKLLIQKASDNLRLDGNMLRNYVKEEPDAEFAELLSSASEKVLRLSYTLERMVRHSI